jgi:hypothetical protein
MLKVVDDPAEPNLAGGSSLDEMSVTALGRCWRRRCMPRWGPSSRLIAVRWMRGPPVGGPQRLPPAAGGNNGGGVRCGCGTRGSTTSASMR